MLYECASLAGLGKNDLAFVMDGVGATEVEELLELYPNDYERCNFRPLLNRRVLIFQEYLQDTNHQILQA